MIHLEDRPQSCTSDFWREPSFLDLPIKVLQRSVARQRYVERNLVARELYV